MYQALIVDDEKEIRDGLAAWSWGECGVEVAGGCTHGLEALQFIGKHPVDIVITDIRMPFMDGIELMTTLKVKFPFVKIIILSGYSDFEYAKQAIQQDAVDYMLKPIVFSDLAQTIRRLTEKLDEQKQSERRTEALKRRANHLAGAFRNSFLARLFREPLSNDELEQDGAEGEVLLEAVSYTVGILLLDRVSLHGEQLSEREQKLLVFSFDNILNDIWDSRGYGYHLVDRNLAEICLLSRNETDDARGDSHERFRDAVRRLLKYIGLFRSTLSLGIGAATMSPGEICQSARSARKSLIGYAEPSVVRIGPALGPKDDRHDDADGSEPAAPASDGSATRGADSLILAEAKKYIRNNYDRGITLKEVADHVYLSKNHLSVLFKNNNETFLKYLTAIRMEKAKVLMRDNRYKIYQIVEMVGYTDPAYFAEVFKRYTHKTPNEYRGKLKVRGGAPNSS